MVREGKIPAYLGTVVTVTGLALRTVNPVAGAFITGFGLAHVLLGTIDLVEHPPEEAQ